MRSGRKPFFGRTVTRSRCQVTRSGPVVGERITAPVDVGRLADGPLLDDLAEDDRRLARRRDHAAESGITAVTTGGTRSGGPPGGSPADAHAQTTTTDASPH